MGKGSTTLSFRLAKPQQKLSYPDYTSFGEEVVTNVTEAVRSFESKRTAERSDVDAGVLDSLKTLGEIFDKKQITKVRFVMPRRNGHRRIDTTFTKSSSERVVGKIGVPRHKKVTIEGTLEMGDFKSIDRRCRVRPPFGQPIVCTFDEKLEEQIYEALRKSTRISGKATINPNTEKVENFHIEGLEVIEEYLMGEREFHATKTVEELATAQGVKPLANSKSLSGGWPEDYDLDEFLIEVYAGRTS